MFDTTFNDQRTKHAYPYTAAQNVILPEDPCHSKYPMYRPLAICWSIELFVAALVSLTGDFATADDWRSDSTRLAFIFGQFVGALRLTIQHGE